MHTLIKLVFAIVIAIIYTYLIVRRPGAPQTTKRSTLAVHLVVGLIIGVVFLETTRWYIQSSPL